MTCLMKYQWVKLMRNRMPEGKGIMVFWARLAAHAAFRNAHGTYLGYVNEQKPGMWVGGMAGLKHILGVRTREAALGQMELLSMYGLIKYELDAKTKMLTYQIIDWVMNCSGKGCIGESAYATKGYGFLCLPRNITERLVEKNYIFEEADAWLDLWCHTVSEDPNNAFSFLSLVIQYGREQSVLTLEQLGKRWGWEKTKVWRFFKKYREQFALIRLPGSYGCVVFNMRYLSDVERTAPSNDDVVRIIAKIRIMGANTHKRGSDNEHINRLVRMFSWRVMQNEDPSAEYVRKTKIQDSRVDQIIKVVINSEKTDWDEDSDLPIMYYVPDAKITIRWDQTEEQEPFDEEWAVKHPDKNAKYTKCYVCYEGKTIKIVDMVWVDGYRAIIPTPERTTNHISRRNYMIGRLLNWDVNNYNEYIIRSGLIVD